MEVDVLRIERKAKASGPHEIAYDVKTRINGQDGAFEALVAMFRDPGEMRIFRHDQRPLTAILSGVLDVYNREQALLPT